MTSLKVMKIFIAKSRFVQILVHTVCPFADIFDFLDDCAPINQCVLELETF